jgi:SNF2 family DNA or RNA helicase
LPLPYVVYYNVSSIPHDYDNIRIAKLDLVQISDLEALLLIITSTAKVETRQIRIPKMGFNEFKKVIDAFDKAPAGSVLLAQIQSGGTGLNIQSASVVVICEPQFKPSIENQAISRAYRMGQARNVLVYRLLCINTIDEKITELLEQKQNIFDAFADKSVAAEQNESRNVEVDDKKFGQLIEEEIKRINAEKAKAEPKDRPTEEPVDSE